MIEVNKAVGKILKQKVPHLCVKTCHGRHYYATESERVMRLIREFETGQVVSVYPDMKDKKGE